MALLVSLLAFTFLLAFSAVEGAILVVVPRNTSAFTYGIVSIPCVAYGNPLPQIVWRKEGVGDLSTVADTDPVISTNYTAVTTQKGKRFAVSTLTLCGLRLTDAGVYSCSVQADPNNQLPYVTGVQNASFNLSVSVGAPELTSFSMDLDSGVLMLSFNKPLRIATFNPTITLQNTGKAPTASLQLSSHLVHTSTDSSVVSLSLSQDNWNALKSTTSLYTSIANSFLSFTSRNTVGVEGVPLLAISMENGTAANALIPDNTSPAVVRIATFDLDAGTFDIVFDEPVNPLTLDVTRILLQDMQSNPTATYMLIGGTAMTLGTPTTIRLIMTTQDRNEVNRLGTLAVDASSTWIAFTSNAIQDFSGNTNIPGIIGAVNFIPDTTPASLRCFTLDMNAAVLGLSFDDLVTQSSFNGNKVRLQSSPSSTTVYKLAAAPMPAGMSDYLEVFIAQDIFNRLQSDVNIATMQNNTYLSATQGFVSDIYSRPASGIPQNNALLGCRYIRDVTAPAIVSFVLDLDEGYLLVTFSEPILPSSFQPSRINIQSSSGSLSPLTGGQVSARNTSIVLQIQLESTDLVHIYNGVTMSQPASSTMLQLSTGAFTDFSGNSLPSSTIAALEIVPDMTPPSLNNFTLNLIDGTVTLVFSEPVTIGNQQQFIGSLALTNNATSPSITLSNAQAPIQFEQSKPDTVILTLPPVLHQVLDSDLIATSVNDLHVVFLPTINVTDFTGFSLQPGVTQARGIVRMCPYNTYNDVNRGTCEGCPIVCREGCTGPNPSTGNQGCVRCEVIQLNTNHDVVKCLNPGDGCPDGTYQVTNGAPIVPYQSLLSGGNRSVCYACDPLCTLCSGPSTTDCSACSHATIPSQTGGRECADSCINNNNCYYCDEECVGCRGESPTDCVSCKNSMMVWNGRDLCVPSCSNDTYLHILPSGKSECIPCDGECNRCTGSSNADCIACLHYTQMTGSGMMCFASCPDGTYTNVTSHCLPCHQDCKRCSGPGNTECYVCQGEDDSVNRTLHVNCGKQCPVGYTYDIEGGDCDLIIYTWMVPLILVIATAACVIVLLVMGIFVLMKKRRTGSKELVEEEEEEDETLVHVSNPIYSLSKMEDAKELVPPESTGELDKAS